MPRLTVSLVIYNNSSSELSELFSALQCSAHIAAWVVVDNAAAENAPITEALREMVQAHGGRYVPAKTNMGFGAGHNLAIRALSDVPSDFHLFVNPDILFDDDVIPKLIGVFDENPSVGRVMPQIHYRDGRLQEINRLLPTPFDLFIRRFLPARLMKLIRGSSDRYQLRGTYNSVFHDVPFMSGCFIFMRRSLIESIGGFDDRYFLYLEDADLSRATAKFAENLYWPHVSITHGYQRGAHNSRRLTWVALQSSVRYFNKWGWIWDTQRTRMNRKALAQRRAIIRGNIQP